MKTYAVITCSHAQDFENCKNLCLSIDQFVDQTNVHHYLIVEKKNQALFQSLQSNHRTLIYSDSLLPWWMIPVPSIFKPILFNKNWWFSFKTKPIRNWIFQQILKIGVAHLLQEDVLVYIDSDVHIIRPFNFSIFEKDGFSRFFKVSGGANIDTHYRWHRAAGKLLGIEIQNYYGARYIGNMISWNRENVIRLTDRIEKISGKRWMETICSQWNLSEYILYGVYVDYILKEESGHIVDENNPCLEYWKEEKMNENEKEEFIHSLEPHHFSVMINAKADISSDERMQIISALQNRAKSFPSV